MAVHNAKIVSKSNFNFTTTSDFELVIDSGTRDAAFMHYQPTKNDYIIDPNVPISINYVDLKSIRPDQTKVNVFALIHSVRWSVCVSLCPLS